MHEAINLCKRAGGFSVWGEDEQQETLRQQMASRTACVPAGESSVCHVSADGAHQTSNGGGSHRAAPHERSEDARGNEEGSAPFLEPQELAGLM